MSWEKRHHLCWGPPSSLQIHPRRRPSATQVGVAGCLSPGDVQGHRGRGAARRDENVVSHSVTGAARNGRPAMPHSSVIVLKSSKKVPMSFILTLFVV